MREIKTKIGQRLADFILNKVSKSEDKEELEFWVSMGHRVDDYFLRRDIHLN